MRNRVKQCLLFLVLAALLMQEITLPVRAWTAAAALPTAVTTASGDEEGKKDFTDSKEKITVYKKNSGKKSNGSAPLQKEDTAVISARKKNSRRTAAVSKQQNKNKETQSSVRKAADMTGKTGEGKKQENLSEDESESIPVRKKEAKKETGELGEKEGKESDESGKKSDEESDEAGKEPGKDRDGQEKEEEKETEPPGKGMEERASAAERLPKKDLQFMESGVNHSLNMPKATYETFILQGKKGKGQRLSASKKVAIFPSNAAIQEDITKNHRDYVSFTPHWSYNTTASLSTHANSRSVKFYVDDPKKAEHVGGIGKPTMSANVVEGRVFLLKDTMKNRLSCTFSNVGRYYDRTAGKSYGIDLKAVLVNFTKKNKSSADVQTAIKDRAIGEEGGPLFCFTGKQGIGVLTAFCDSVVVRYEYYIHGTQTPIYLKGFARFSDIDAQQGIEFSSQADYFYAVSEADQYLGCSKGVYTPGNKAYIYALSSKAYPGGEGGHGFYTLFSGNNLTLRYTFAKCSRKDDGGKKNGNALTQYGVPFDTSEVKHYTSSASRGYIRFDARQPYLAEPEIRKYVFNGKDIQGEVNTPHQAVANTLPDRKESFTYKIRAICPYEDASEHHYATWIVKDQISPYLVVEQAEIYDGTGEKSTDFVIDCRKQNDGSTLVTATAVDSAAQKFYEKNWYDLYITVRVKTGTELQQQNLDFSGKYRKNGEDIGKYVLENKATLSVGKEYTSNETKTVIPQWIKVKKVNENNEPVQGITFGIFQKKGIDAYAQKPLMTAVSGKDGIAHFRRATFFNLAGKSGPYYLKEISRGKWENVYVADQEWYQAFSCDEGNRMIDGEIAVGKMSTLKNKSKKVRKYSVCVRKKNKETTDFLSGAIFGFYQWSETGKGFMRSGELVETKDDRGQIVYRNDREFTATEDNQGRFMIKEEKAPFGCYSVGESWTFSTTDRYEQNQEAIEFYTVSGTGRQKKQTKELIIENKLQKGILEIQKTDELNVPVGKAVFTITAVEDIYAPWQCTEDGKPKEGQEPLVAAGTICDTLETDQKGKAFSKALYLGKYQVTEINGAPGHIKTDEVYEVTFPYPEDDEKKLVNKTLKASNHRILPDFSVAKIADRTTNEEGDKVEFDPDRGRYIEKKIPGTYQPSEVIRYGITVTNTGNVDLYHLRLTEQMDELNENQQKLCDYIDKERASFVIPENGWCKTAKGDRVRCSKAAEDGRTIRFDRLSSGDSVTVYFEAPVLSSGVNVYHLKNRVVGSASFDNREGKPGEKLIPVNTKDLVDEQGRSLAEDEDLVNLPGTPGNAVVKKADRTTGCTVENGVLNGVKVPGIYYGGEEICFSIHVRNSGTANLKNILVTDLMSPELKQVTEEETAEFRLKIPEGIQNPEDEDRKTEEETKGDKEETKQEDLWNSEGEDEGDQAEKSIIFTNKGKKLSVKKVDDHQLLLGEDGDTVTGKGTLQPGDSVILYYYVKVKKDAANNYDLVNTVKINASYFTGEEEKELPEIRNSDAIGLPGIPEVRIAKIADRTTGAVLRKGRYTKEKIAGSYANGDRVTYTITVTNTGSADLYDLKVWERMEERLVGALETESIHFQSGRYKTVKGNTVLAVQKGKNALVLNQLKAGDRVDLLLHGKVDKTAGDLYALENKVYVTGHYKKGNEGKQKEYDQFAGTAETKYFLFYHANNGTAAKTQDSETPAYARKKVKINGNPFVKEDDDFLGWNTRADGTGKDYAPGAELTMPGQDVHLYARWAKRGTILKKQYTYTLLYHSNTPLAQRKPDSETRCPGGTAITVDDNGFKYEGYQFLGWSLTPEEQEVFIKPGEAYRMPEMDVHLYAQWKKIRQVTLVYHDNIPDRGETNTDYQTPCAAGTKLTLNQNLFDREDYQFAGWSKNKDAQEPEFYPQDNILLEEDTHLYAVWIKKEDGEEKLEYSLFYHGNNEKADTSVDSQTPCEEEKKILLDTNSFQYKGHGFLGWNTRPDGTGKQWEENQEYTMPARNVHLYAQWKKDVKHTLSYDSNYPEAAGKQNEQVADAETPCTKDELIEVDGSAFRCDGHVFLGWSMTPDGSTALILPDETLKIVSDMTLYAVWTEQSKEYTLLYSSNTEKTFWETAPQSPAPAGTPQKLIPNPFTHKEASFAGWSINPKADPESKEILVPGTWFRQPDKNVTLYAIWKKETNFQLIYDGNGGSRNEESDREDDPIKKEQMTDEETPCIAGDTVRINPSPFKRKGCRFIGWSTQPLKPLELKSGDRSDENDFVSQEQPEELFQKVCMTYPGCSHTMPDKEVTLYAVWEKLPNKHNNMAADTDEAEELADSPYTPIPVTLLMQDWDKINIPGKPDLRIAKKAERTKGVRLKEGRYRGKRKPGTYAGGEHVLYTLTASNYGTGTAYDVVVREKPTKAWAKALDAEGFSVQEGEILQTAKGASVRVKKAERNVVILDHLPAGDRITLTFASVVKQENAKKRKLKNIAKITGQKKDGSAVEKSKYGKDMDVINIKTENEETPASTDAGNIPQTGDQRPIVLYIMAGSISILCLCYTLFRRRNPDVKKKKEKKKRQIDK